MKEQKEGWSSLEGLAQSIGVYFGEKIGNEAEDLLVSLNKEPVHNLDIHEAANYIAKMQNSNALTLDNIAVFLTPYILPVPHSIELNRKLNVLGVDMKCVIRRSIKIESDLSSNSC